MLIKDILDQEHYFHFMQPIYDISAWRVIGYEMLLRSDKYTSTEIMFQIAKKEEKLFELDTSSIKKVITNYYSQSYPYQKRTVYLKVYSSTLENDNFPEFLTSLIPNIPEDLEVIFEVNIVEKIQNIAVCLERVTSLQRSGFKVALEGIGKASNGLKYIIELKPNIVKCDKYFSDSIDIYPEKQMVISLINKYCEEFNIQFILTGIERPEELAISKLLNVHYAQGYGLCRPFPISLS